MLFAIARSDGGVSIMRLVEGTEIDAELEKLQKMEPGLYLSVRPIAKDDVPNDRTFRNAWKIDGETIGHDMEKCRAMHRERMRAARAPKLAALDVAYQRADEMQDEVAKATIAAQKQALRDVTSDRRIGTARTPEDLKAVWPASLA